MPKQKHSLQQRMIKIKQQKLRMLSSFFIFILISLYCFRDYEQGLFSIKKRVLDTR